jgi:hypothetical protein
MTDIKKKLSTLAILISKDYSLHRAQERSLALRYIAWAVQFEKKKGARGTGSFLLSQLF